jgi:hypothetical protein
VYWALAQTADASNPIGIDEGQRPHELHHCSNVGNLSGWNLGSTWVAGTLPEPGEIEDECGVPEIRKLSGIGAGHLLLDRQPRSHGDHAALTNVKRFDVSEYTTDQRNALAVEHKRELVHHVVSSSSVGW